MAAQMDRLQEYHAERDSARDDAAMMADERVVVMAQAIEALVLKTEAEQQAASGRAEALSGALSRLADGQERLIELVPKMRLTRRSLKR